MPDEITIYHNPRCSKSREALKLLQERGEDPKVVEYLKDPPSKSTLAKLFKLLADDPVSAVRKKEQAYDDAGLSSTSTQGEIVAAIAEAPVLLERPIVVRGEKAVIGRPPERALELL